MNEFAELASMPPAHDRLLFTPGPLTTSQTVKQAMLRDLGSRDAAFLHVVRDIRVRLLGVAGAGAEYTSVLMQGSGTFGIEALLGSVVPRAGKLLVAINGAYGRRMAQIADVLAISAMLISANEDQPIDPAQIDAALAADPTISHVAVVHCETTSGIMNPIDAVGAVVQRHQRSSIVDAMSSFGAVPIDLAVCGIDFLVSSANKCIEGVPGFAFVIARLDALQAAEGHARSLSLDLLAQWRELERSGQFRFTPPTHALLAFQQALRELEQEGGVPGRAARYHANHQALLAGMRQFDFTPYLAAEHQSPIITSFRYPHDPRFDFATFYERLSERGYVIYPGKLSREDCFRIGTIGRIFPGDVQALLAAIGLVLAEMYL